jgi:LemA protein
MKTSTIIVIGIIAVLFLGSLASYNGLINADERANKEFANIEVMLQRRYDLIPNLVNTVKGYATHEKSVFVEVTNARSQWAKASTVSEKVEASNQMEGALARLLVVSENYPQLKANANFTQLQDELAGTENRIAVARKDYNEAVAVVNAKVRRLPSSIFAGMADVSKREPFKAAETAKTAPTVQF